MRGGSYNSLDRIVLSSSRWLHNQTTNVSNWWNLCGNWWFQFHPLFQKIFGISWVWHFGLHSFGQKCGSGFITCTVTAFSTTSTILGGPREVRHQPVKAKRQIYTVVPSPTNEYGCGWDLNTSKRKLSQSSMRNSKLYELWLWRLSPIRTMWPKPTWSGPYVADAFAAGSKAGIGGVIYFPRPVPMVQPLTAIHRLW